MLNLECTKLVEVSFGMDVIASVEQVARAQFNSEHSDIVVKNLSDLDSGVVESVFETEIYTKSCGEVVYSEYRYIFMITEIGDFHKIEMYRK